MRRNREFIRRPPGPRFDERRVATVSAIIQAGGTMRDLEAALLGAPTPESWPEDP
jgi:hypothetical protein